MNEFEWEEQLRESDQLTDKYMRLIEKYGDGPEAQQEIAREMGWSSVGEGTEADEPGKLASDIEQECMAEDFAEPAPDPRAEGVDWVLDQEGAIRHPLALCAQLHAIALWQRCADFDSRGDGGDPDLHAMVFEAQVLAAKLAGALDAFATRPTHEDAGFIVACLKRALLPLNRCLAHVEKVADKQLLAPEQINASRQVLFHIREKMLELMQRYRQEESAS